jgi:Bacteriophage HK97-gp10, putative tail-component
VSGLQITRADWDSSGALDTVDSLGRTALEWAGERLLAAAGPRTPYRTGALAASAQLVAGDDGVAVGYTAPHARYVHAHPEWQFSAGRSGRWLDEAVTAEADATGAVIADTIRSGWPG